MPRRVASRPPGQRPTTTSYASVEIVRTASQPGRMKVYRISTPCTPYQNRPGLVGSNLAGLKASQASTRPRAESAAAAAMCASNRNDELENTGHPHAWARRAISTASR